jgi:hypothetical protein
MVAVDIYCVCGCRSRICNFQLAVIISVSESEFQRIGNYILESQRDNCGISKHDCIRYNFFES